MEKNKLFNLYLWVVSVFSVIALAINLWIILTMAANFVFITDAEYVASNYSYKLENCENWGRVKTMSPEWETTTQTRTEEEIEECKEQAREDLATQRRFRLKEDLIASGAWFIVFIILFGLHYPQFKWFDMSDNKSKKKTK